MIYDWQDEKTNPAPKGSPILLVFAQGGVGFGYKDAMGNWRARHHHPRSTPSHWMNMIPGPKAALIAEQTAPLPKTEAA